MHYAFEPELFKNAFRRGGWSNFEKPELDQRKDIGEISSEGTSSENSQLQESDIESDEEGNKPKETVEGAKLSKQSLLKATQVLVVESYWIN